MCSLVELEGDLFGCPADNSLVHCVSRDLRMGKGIAVKFKDLFGGISELKAQNVQVGGVAVLDRQDRFVYYLITKEQYFNKPTYESLRQSLEAMRNHALLNDVKHLAMPKIGCGLDGLQWGKVKNILEEVFHGSEIQLNVWTFK